MCQHKKQCQIIFLQHTDFLLFLLFQLKTEGCVWAFGLWAQPYFGGLKNCVSTVILSVIFYCAQHSTEVYIGSIRDMGERERERS